MSEDGQREPVAGLSSPATGRARARRWVVLIAVISIHTLIITKVGLKILPGTDFFAYYLSARALMTGHSPYEAARDWYNFDDPVFHDASVAHFQLRGWNEASGREALMKYVISSGLTGVLYPPQAYLILLPFSRLPWNLALGTWVAFLTVACLACGTLAWSFDRGPSPRTPMAGVWIIAVMLLNPLTLYSMAYGQIVLVICASVALGQWAVRRGYYRAGVIIWSFCVVKPQLGFPFLVLSYLLGGWRQFRDVCLAGAILNLVSGLALSGDPMMVVDYLRSLHGSAVESYMSDKYNRVENDEIVSWDHVLWVLGGPSVALNALRVFAGYATWGLLLASRIYLGARRGCCPAFYLAAAISASLICAHTHNHDMVLLWLLIPYVLWLWDNGHHPDAYFLGALIAVCSVPRRAVVAACACLGLGPYFAGTPWETLVYHPGAADLLLSYRAFVSIILGLYLLVRGQPRPWLMSGKWGDGRLRPSPDGRYSG